MTSTCHTSSLWVYITAVLFCVSGLDDMSHLITMGLYYSRIVLCLQAGLDDMSHLITMGLYYSRIVVCYRQV